MFTSTYTTRDTLVDSASTHEQRLEWFTKRLRVDYETTQHVGLQTLDMFVFPVNDGEHFYVMSVSLKHKRFDVIDSSFALKTNHKKYGGAPENLIDLFASFLDNVDQPLRAMFVCNLRPKRMQIHWRDLSNKVDSGVFAMRHMESYIG